VEVRLISNPDGFARLKSAWSALYERHTPRSPFLAHEWFEAAWRWRKDSARMRIFACWRAEQLVGVMPLVVDGADESSGRHRRLEFLAVPDTQTCDVLADAGDRRAVASAIADELVRRRREWDSISFRHLPRGALTATELREALSRHGLRCEVIQATSNPWIALESTWAVYYASRSRRLKKAINLAQNRLAKAGTVALRRLAADQMDPTEIRRWLDRITAISAKSWKNRTGNSLNHDGPNAFLCCLAEQAPCRHWLSIWELSLNEQPVAMELQLVDGGDIFALRSDFDASYDALSAGSHLNRLMLEQLFGRGFRRYLMGPGENPYKYRWADDAEPVATMTVYGTTLRGQWHAARDLMLKPAMRRIRDRLRPPESADAANPQPDTEAKQR